MNLHSLKIGDIILIPCLIFAAAVSFFVMRQEQSQAKWCIVSVDGKDVYKLLLANNKQVKIIGPLGESIVEIQDNGVRMKNSPCPLKVCMHQGRINKPGQTIVCVPNRIMIRIMGEKKVDAITE